MTKKRGLGRGLATLLSDINPAIAEMTRTEDLIPPLPGVQSLKVSQLQRGKYQPRKTMNNDSLQELADSIKAQGIIQPIVVREISQGQYEILAGERRFRAAQMAGLTDVPVVIRAINDQDAMALALIENIQREDLNPLEEAIALQRLLSEFDLTHDEVAKTLGKSRSGITNLLRLLNLTPEVQKMIEDNQLEAGHGKALLSLQTDAQIQAAKLVFLKGLSVRETERLVKSWATSVNHRQLPVISPEMITLKQRLAKILGTKVILKHNEKGKGKLIIAFKTLAELEKIFDNIKE